MRHLQLLSVFALCALYTRSALADETGDRAAAKAAYGKQKFTEACPLYEKISQSTYEWRDFFREAMCKVSLVDDMFKHNGDLATARNLLVQVIDRLSDVQERGSLSSDQSKLVDALKRTSKATMNRIDDIFALQKAGGKTEEARKNAEAELGKSRKHSADLVISIAEKEVEVARLELQGAITDRKSLDLEGKQLAAEGRAAMAERKLADRDLAEGNAQLMQAKSELAAANSSGSSEAVNSATKHVAEAEAKIHAASDSISATDSELAKVRDEQALLESRKKEADRRVQDKSSALKATEAKLTDAKAGRIP